jgi:hypothetical protein
VDRVDAPGPDHVAERKGRALSDMFGKSNEADGYNREGSRDVSAESKGTV